MEYKAEFSELNELADDTASAEETAENTVETETVDETAALEYEVTEETAVKAKKKFPLMTPIIIGICVLLAAVIAYFAISIFTPTVEGTWVYESEDGYTFYYTFEEKSGEKKCVMNIGTIYFPGTYDLAIGEEASTVTVSASAGYVNGNYTYTIDGNKLLKNRVLTLTGEDGTAITLNQAKKTKDSDFVKPAEDFKPVESLVGEWEFVYEEYGVSYKLNINEDGTLVYDQFGMQEIHCAYTADDKTINLSFFETELITQEEEYYFDGDQLIFLGINWSKVSDSTADQA